MRRHERRAAGAPRCLGDAGQVGGIEVLPFGFLVLVAGMLLVANLWGVVDARMAVARAAREGTRAFVEADDAEAAERAAITRAEETLSAHGRAEGATVNPPRVDGGFARCGRVEITVSALVPALVIPFVGGFGELLEVSATHSELIDPYRSGPAGAATC